MLQFSLCEINLGKCPFPQLNPESGNPESESRTLGSWGVIPSHPLSPQTRTSQAGANAPGEDGGVLWLVAPATRPGWPARQGTARRLLLEDLDARRPPAREQRGLRSGNAAYPPPSVSRAGLPLACGPSPSRGSRNSFPGL